LFVPEGESRVKREIGGHGSKDQHDTGHLKKPQGTA